MSDEDDDQCSVALAKEITALCDVHDLQCSLTALVAVLAHVVVEDDDPAAAGLEVVRAFVETLEDAIDDIPAERIITLPPTSDQN